MFTAYDFIPKHMKVMTFIVNVLYWLLGIYSIGVGHFVHTHHVLPLTEFISMEVNPGYMTILMGMLLFVTTILGFVGTLRENVTLLRWYIGTLILLFMIYVTMGAFILSVMCSKPSVSNYVESKLQKALIAYKDDDQLADYMNKMQTSLQCCGIGSNGYLDWTLNPYFACDEDNFSVEKCSVPASCCRLDKMEVIDLTCGFGVTNEGFISQIKASYIINTEGCVPRLEEIIHGAAALLGFSVFGISTFLILGVILSRRVVKILEIKVSEYWKRTEFQNHVIFYNENHGIVIR